MIPQDTNPIPVITVTGLPGSGSEVLGKEIARLTGCRFVDDEISKKMCRRLQRSTGELEALEASYRSWWRGQLWEFLVSHEQTAIYGDGYDGSFALSSFDYYDLQSSLTKEEYFIGLKSVVSELSQKGNVVLHGQGSHLFIPSNVAALHVFVAAPKELRKQRVAVEGELSVKEAEQWLKKADKTMVSIFKHLLGADLLDNVSYDLVLNLEHMSYEKAALMVVGSTNPVTFYDHQPG